MSATDTEVRLDKVLVIIPTYNEVENVETIVARTRRANPNVVRWADSVGYDWHGQSSTHRGSVSSDGRAVSVRASSSPWRPAY